MTTKLKLVIYANFFLLACSVVATDQGPGMITNFGSMMEGRSARIQAITLPNGKRAMSGFTVRGGKVSGWRRAIRTTTGMSGDTRSLPDWLDFAWQEPSYPGPNQATLQLGRITANMSLTKKLACRSRLSASSLAAAFRQRSSRKSLTQDPISRKVNFCRKRCCGFISSGQMKASSFAGG